jgi:glyoxylate/succinic semialdehyde reductase
MRFALGLGDQLAQPLPVAAAANERMIAARALGHDESDFSAVYEACRAPKT